MAAISLSAVRTASGKDSERAIVADTGLCSARAAAAGESERLFLAGNQRAMDKMMTGMVTKPTGDVDEDFAATMIPHHQGAIDMAVLELRYGRNEQLRRIAQEIIVDQQQEIAAMRLALGQQLPPPTAAPTQTGASLAPGSGPTPTGHPMEDMSK
ncbi:DUF305 domain-containing protein [Paraburkholderia sp. J12]|uniref:DUF305 domain-containing protein n=1 Tax=Paraburkholderia sp. J12 TaxID=2805432 RepID=UPI0039F5FF27